jgi:hypothetical protein
MAAASAAMAVGGWPGGVSGFSFFSWSLMWPSSSGSFSRRTIAENGESPSAIASSAFYRQPGWLWRLAFLQPSGWRRMAQLSWLKMAWRLAAGGGNRLIAGRGYGLAAASAS